MKPTNDPFDQALALLQLGAPASYLLLLLSLTALTLIIVKSWEFWELRLVDRSFIGRALLLFHRGQAADAQTLLQQHRGPLPSSLSVAIAAASNPAFTRAEAEEFTRVYANGRLEDTRALLRPIEVISQLAPLTGLLGTVLGMITAFKALQMAGENVSPAALSGGIWEALLTTAAGLVVAIPCIAALHFFERRIDKMQGEIESALTRLFMPPLSLPASAEAPQAEVRFGGQVS